MNEPGTISEEQRLPQHEFAMTGNMAEMHLCVHCGERRIHRNHFIGAAPLPSSVNQELLEALKELLRVDDAWHGSINSEMSSARNKARAAISRAEKERR